MYTYVVGDFNSSWRNVYSYGVKTQPGEIDRIIALDRNGKVKGPALGGGGGCTSIDPFQHFGA